MDIQGVNAFLPGSLAESLPTKDLSHLEGNYEEFKVLKLDKEKNNIVIGYGAPAKATTGLNFFGVSKEIDFIVEDNKLKHNKFSIVLVLSIY